LYCLNAGRCGDRQFRLSAADFNIGNIAFGIHAKFQGHNSLQVVASFRIYSFRGLEQQPKRIRPGNLYGGGCEFGVLQSAGCKGPEENSGGSEFHHVIFIQMPGDVKNEIER
jgi:hypothetical protein